MPPPPLRILSDYHTVKLVKSVKSVKLVKSEKVRTWNVKQTGETSSFKSCVVDVIIELSFWANCYKRLIREMMFPAIFLFPKLLK